MLDPLSALNVATAVTQFLSFSANALELCKEIRDDAHGATNANKSLEHSIQDFNDIARDIRAAASQDSSGRRLSSTAKQCVTLSDDLLKLLEEVRQAGRQRPSVVKATIRALKDKRKIEKLQNAVQKRQAVLDTALSHDTR
jgi:thiamine biosynthesis lipoprotein ApbE